MTSLAHTNIAMVFVELWGDFRASEVSRPKA